jgi:hypothetical protein
LGSTSLATGGFPIEANAGDMNGDGILDLVSANNAASGLSVLLGLGGGAFAPAVPYFGGTSMNGLRLDDLDGDGDLDAAVASASDAIYVFLGNGAGARAGPTTYVLSSQSLVRQVAVCDVDGDGRRDIVAGTLGSGAMAVLRGLGAGLFAAPDIYPAGGAVQGFTMGDIDADGRPDVVAIAATKISVLRNQLSTPAGTAPYGAGTPGCGGILGFTANKPPKVGDATYGYVCTNAPHGALGLGFATDLQDAAGSDPFSLGITLHVGFLGASQLIAYDLHSDATGTAFAPAPIPNFPFLVGSNFYVQTLWLEALAQGQACGPSPFHLVTSAAVAVTVQP